MVTGLGATVSLILTLFIKFFFIVFIIGLVGGFIVAAKNYVFTTEDIAVLKGSFKGSKVEKLLDQDGSSN